VGDSVRGWIGLALALDATLTLIDPAAAETDATIGDQWRQTDKTMSELVGEGYELVSVVAPTSHMRTYFLRKPGKVAKCTEATALETPPPPPVPETLTKGQSYGVMTSGEPPKTRVDTQCAELVSPQR
jgi:hypothetical protein